MSYDLGSMTGACPLNDGGMLVHIGSGAYGWRCNACGTQFELQTSSGNSLIGPPAQASNLVRSEVIVSTVQKGIATLGSGEVIP